MDREKVIRELKAARLFFEMGSNRADGVVGNLGCKSGMKYIDDALVLLEEQEVRGEIDIREIDGLWCDDITFCPEKCGWRKCPRNKVNIRDRTVPHSYFVETPPDCPKQIEEAR